MLLCSAVAEREARYDALRGAEARLKDQVAACETLQRSLGAPQLPSDDLAAAMAILAEATAGVTEARQAAEAKAALVWQAAAAEYGCVSGSGVACWRMGEGVQRSANDMPATLLKIQRDFKTLTR